MSTGAAVIPGSVLDAATANPMWKCYAGKMSSNKETDSGASVPPAVVTAEDFQSVDFSVAIAGTDRVDCLVLSQAFNTAGQTAKAEGDNVAFRVFQLMASICGFHFRVEDRAGAFGPQFAF